MSEGEYIGDAMGVILEELEKTYQKIHEVFGDCGWDLAYFDVDINLLVKVGRQQVGVKESWKALES